MTTLTGDGASTWSTSSGGLTMDHEFVSRKMDMVFHTLADILKESLPDWTNEILCHGVLQKAVEADLISKFSMRIIDGIVFVDMCGDSLGVFRRQYRATVPEIVAMAVHAE